MHFFYAMAMNPECQRRLQEELDRSIGNGRSPSFAEIEKLPYFNA
jgi:Cytochrome P450